MLVKIKVDTCMMTFVLLFLLEMAFEWFIFHSKKIRWILKNIYITWESVNIGNMTFWLCKKYKIWFCTWVIQALLHLILLISPSLKKQTKKPGHLLLTVTAIRLQTWQMCPCGTGMDCSSVLWSTHWTGPFFPIAIWDISWKKKKESMEQEESLRWDVTDILSEARCFEEL